MKGKMINLRAWPASAAVMLLLAAWPLYSATVTWTNTLGGFWSNTNNWSPHQVPGGSDTILITTPGTYTVKADNLETVFNVPYLPTVTLGAASGAQTLLLTNLQFSYTNFLINANGVLVASNSDIGVSDSPPPYPVLAVSGGLLNATNTFFFSPLVITNGAKLNSSNNMFFGVTVSNATFNSTHDTGGAFPPVGTPIGQILVANKGVLNSFNLTMNGPLTVSTGGVMNATTETVMNGNLTNSGTLNITNDEILVGYGTGVGGFWNEPTGAIFLNGTSAFNGGVSDSGTSASFVTNRGAMTEITGPGTTMALGYVDNSSGIITNLSGLLALSTVTNLAGTFYAAAGTMIQFAAGTNVVSPGVPLLLSGAGVYELTSGNLYLPTNNIPNLYFDGALGSALWLGPSFQGGAITNLQAEGVTITNTLPVKGNFTLTNSGVYGNFTVASGGSLVSSNIFYHGNINVASGGNLALHTGALDGTVTVAAGGTLTVSGGTAGSLGGVVIPLGLVNAGTLNVSNCQFQVTAVTNQTGGVINLLGSGSSFLPVTVQEPFVLNQGSIIQNAAAAGGTNYIMASTFDASHGVVTNFGGVLILQGFQTNLAGIFTASGSGTIQMSGGTATNPLVAGPPSVSSGQVQFTGGWLSFPTNIIPGLELMGGTLQLGPTFQGAAITNLTVLGITLTNNFPVKGIFTASNNSSLYGNFTVQSGGVFYDSATTYGALIVAGGATVWGQGGMAVGSSGSLSIASGGTVNVQNGAAGPGLSLAGPTTNSGTINLTNGPAFPFTGISIAYINPIYLGSLLNQATGVINFGSDSTEINVPIGSGTFVNNGTVVKTAGSGTSVIQATFLTNSGTILADSGIVYVSSPITLTAASSLKVGLNSASNYGQIAFQTNTALTGTFTATLNNGYIPVNGATFNPLFSLGSISGTFGTVTLPAGITWQKTYGATNLELTVVSSLLQIASIAKTGTNIILTGSGGTQGNNYTVLISTNLAISYTNWTPLVTNTFGTGGNFSFTNPISPTKPRQFYIIKTP